MSRKKVSKKAKQYIYSVMYIGEGEDEGYEAKIPKFPGATVYGDDLEDLHEGVLHTIDFLIEERQKEGRPVPSPDIKPSEDFKGKIILRTTPELHKKLYYEAKVSQLSLNKYIESKLKS